MTYVPGSDWRVNKKSFPKKPDHWIIGLLYFVEPHRIHLQGLHITVSRPSIRGHYSDLHVTFKFPDQHERHIYYQITGDKPVTNYALGPKDSEKDALWIAYCAVRDTTEREMIPFAKYCSSLGARGYQPGQVDPNDPGESFLYRAT